MTRNYLVILISIFLIALILLTTPTKSLEILIKGLSGTYTKGSLINFLIEVNISSNEHLPINLINLNINGSSNYNCKIYMNNSVEGCPFLSVNSIDFDSFSYGYGYGYENIYHYLGYGYGYGPDKVRINLTLDTANLNGLYDAKVEIYAGINPDTHIFSSSLYSFIIEEKQTQPSTPTGGSLKYFFEILDIKSKNNTYMVKIRNSGTESLKIYLIIELPEGNQTSQPIELNSREEATLNYTLKRGSYNYRIIVIGEADGVMLAKYINMQTEEIKEDEIKENKNEVAETEKGEEYDKLNQIEEKLPTTGLVVAILETLNKYKLMLILGFVIFIAGFILIKFR